VPWLCRRPVDRLGDVVRGHRLHARVHGIGLFLVAAEPDGGELRVGHAWLDTGDADAGAVQVTAQIQAELVHERLRPGVHVPAGVWVAARDRAEVDDMTTAAVHHAWQDRTRAVDQALAVCVDHLVPVVQVRVLGRAQAQGQARVVHQHVDLGELGRQQGHGGGHGGPVLDVERDGQDAVAEFDGQVLEPVRAPGGGDDAGAGCGEPARGRGAEAAASAGNEDDAGLGVCHD
jgi:hypothetical protein